MAILLIQTVQVKRGDIVFTAEALGQLLIGLDYFRGACLKSESNCALVYNAEYKLGEKTIFYEVSFDLAAGDKLIINYKQLHCGPLEHIKQWEINRMSNFFDLCISLGDKQDPVKYSIQLNKDGKVDKEVSIESLNLDTAKRFLKFMDDALDELIASPA